jgi:glycosyltransferase involved in cell wall biosynthesis
MMSFIIDILPYLCKDFEITLWGVSTDDINKSTIDIKGKPYTFRQFSKVKAGKKIIPNIVRVVFDISLKAKSILSEGYDILYFHGIPLAFPFLRKKKDGPKIVNHIHGITNPFSVNESKFARNTMMINIYEKYRQWVVERSALILLASDMRAYNRFLEHFNKEVSKKIVYVPNFADENIFKKKDKIEARKKLSLPLDHEILIYTGRLSIQKDPSLLLDSFSYLKNNLKINARLFLIGDGELRSEIERKIKEMQLFPDIILLGRRTREEIAIWLNAADVYVYTSFGNGFPISLIEAAMCGLPIVSTDVTGVHDLVINAQTGYLTYGRDYEDIAFKIKMALENKQMLSRNILNISKNYTAEKIAEIILEQFSKLN